MREKQVEQALVKAVKRVGDICPKFTSPGLAGVPDRLVLMPNGKLGFVEVKAPGKKPRSLQLFRMKQLTDLGFQCFVLDEIDQIPELLERIGGDV
ncbi:VRR-NUC domain-containing protein [Listeria monocytogenes]|nr:VRR-NUC domain-containing protein [Listeria monocytogenes]EAH2085675.1 VRR-NUC domain-containing protein [Listeria monocytogenes]EAH2086165.1 VRR-NUC domain-containing protein [Listeria monocytogenes]EAH3168765.1 VRR-NUC domain-containing protein [Listeria monocytogenes]EAH3169195.1 VRR-NUC domain-containing protein [Listeria monocytogenes]